MRINYASLPTAQEGNWLQKKKYLGNLVEIGERKLNSQPGFLSRALSIFGGL